MAQERKDVASATAGAISHKSSLPKHSMGLFNLLFGKREKREEPPRANNSSSDEVKRIIAQAEGMVANGQTREANDVFMEATRVAPNCVEAWVALARYSHQYQNRPYTDYVFGNAEKALASDPGNPLAREHLASAYFDVGCSCLNNHDEDESFRHLRKAFDIAPETFEHKRLTNLLPPTGVREDQEHMVDAFMEMCRCRLESYPKEARTLFWLGRVYAARSYDEEAQLIAANLETIDPDLADKLRKLLQRK